jgi:outer membrane protein X
VYGQIYDREFKPFKIDASLGYGIPKGTNVTGGVMFSFEPKYAITGDAFSFGLRLEGATTKLTPQNSTGGGGSSNSTEPATNISGLITCDYYFSNNNVRPFLGGGTGVYNITTENGKDEGALLPDLTVATKLGFMFRGGIEWGHLRTGVEYNFVGNAGGDPFKYIGLKIGILLGGGRFELISSNRNPF